jgi:hypothetical protein
MAIAARFVLLTALSLATAAVPLAAQERRPTRPPTRRSRATKPPPRIDRGYFIAGAGLQLTPTTFTDVVRPIEFAEPALINSSFRSTAGASIDLGGAYHVRDEWSVGLQVTRLGKAGRDAVSAQVPHPFVFNRLRAVDGDAQLDRTETGVHLQAIWTRPVFRRWQGSVSAGPSWIRVGQDLVQDVTVTQIYPYDTATFAGTVAPRRSATHLGFNLGAAADYEATRRVAVRISLTFTHANVSLAAADSHTVNVSAGGARLGGGVLFRF